MDHFIPRILILSVLSIIAMLHAWKLLSNVPYDIPVQIEKDHIPEDDLIKRVAVIDNVFYDGEPILPLRLSVLYDKVDRFYIVESNYTMDGRRKTSLHKDLNEHLLKPFQDKITWVLVGEEISMDQSARTYEEKRRDLRMASMSNIEDDVDEEIISTPFVIINSEVDEIINPNDIDESQLVENTMIW